MMLVSTRSKFSKQLKFSRCHVQNAVKKYKQLARFDDLKRIRRLKKLSGREVSHLKRLVKGDSRLSASKIATANSPEPLTTRTVRRYSKDFALQYVVKTKTSD